MADDQVPAHGIQINLVDIFQTFGSEEPMPKVLARIEFQVQDPFGLLKTPIWKGLILSKVFPSRTPLT